MSSRLAFTIARCAAWSLCLLWTLLVSALGLLLALSARSDVGLAAAAALTAAALVSGYVLARCVGELSTAAERLFS